MNAQADRADLEQLALLAIFHYIAGGLIIALSSLFIVHVVFGLLIALDPELFRTPRNPSGFPPAIFGYAMAAFAGAFVVAGWIVGCLTIYSGRCLHKHQRRFFSLVVAGIACLCTPFGTLLGVFTILVLSRDSVKRLYGE